MARAAFRQIVLGAAAAGLLIGCVEGAGTGAGVASGGADAAQPATRRRGNAEVEAPEVFQISDTALWDGRPSLGGIWVASPDTTDPERVVLVNPANGKTVTGALFRRERDNPGPPLQISSDAAEALGILAGQPTEIRVTALRKIDAAPEAATEVPAEAAPENQVATDGAAADPTEATAIAAAALDAVDAGADGIADVVATPPEDAAPRKKTWKERRAEARATREAARAAKAAEAAGVLATDPAAGTSETAIVATVETAPLDARDTEVAADADAAAAASGNGDAPPVLEKRKTRRQIRAEADAAKAAAAADAPLADAPPATPAATARPIQIASFSGQENADRAIDALGKIGVTATARKSESNGKVVWGVIAMGDAALLASIKGAGFADAFFLQ